jgi:hypothetical protein
MFVEKLLKLETGWKQQKMTQYEQGFMSRNMEHALCV